MADSSFSISDWSFNTDTINMSNISILTESYTDFGLNFTYSAKEGGALNLSLSSFSLDLSGSADISVSLVGQQSVSITSGHLDFTCNQTTTLTGSNTIEVTITNFTTLSIVVDDYDGGILDGSIVVSPPDPDPATGMTIAST